MKRIVMAVILSLVIGGCGDDTPERTEASKEGGTAAPPERNAAPATPQKAGAAEAPGEAVYRHYCADCHDPGPGHPGTMRLALRLDTAVLRERTDLAPDYVKFVVRNGYQMMPAFRPTEIADSELDGLAAYVAAATIAARK